MNYSCVHKPAGYTSIFIYSIISICGICSNILNTLKLEMLMCTQTSSIKYIYVFIHIYIANVR